MKNKELATIIIGVILILAFSIWLFSYQKEMDKNNLIREDLRNDSIIMIDHSKLADSDSVIFKRLKNHEYRIRKLEQ